MATQLLISHLNDKLTTPIYEYITELYHDIEKHYADLDNPSSSLSSVFQREITKASKWSHDYQTSQIKSILKKINCEYLLDLIHAIISRKIELLGRMNDVTYPSLHEYLYATLLHVFRSLWSNPLLLLKNSGSSVECQQNIVCITEIIEKSIDKSIRDFIPFDELLYGTTVEEEDDESVTLDGVADIDEPEDVTITMPPAPPVSEDDNESDEPDDESDTESVTIEVTTPEAPEPEVIVVPAVAAAPEPDVRPKRKVLFKDAKSYKMYFE
jgi:hypothetical protein